MKYSFCQEAKTEAPKPSPKANPLAKFLVKMAPGKIPPKKVIGKLKLFLFIKGVTSYLLTQKITIFVL